MRKWFRFLIIALTFSTEPLRAADREAGFAAWASGELLPWFEAQPDHFFTSKVPSAKTVILRYKTFSHKEARGHIVMVHGYGERMEKHMEMAYDFHQAGFNVFIFDQRGFGRSTRLNPEGKDAIYVDRFDDYTQDLRQFITEQVKPAGALPIVLFGHSMGGLVVTRFLHAFPGQVEAAILSAPMHQIHLKGVPAPMALLLTIVADGLGYGPGYALGQVGPRKPEYGPNAATTSRVRWQFYADFYSRPEEWPLSLGGASFHWLGEALRAGSQVTDPAWASQVTTPVLLFQADQDTYVSPEGQNIFCQHAPRCRKIFVPGTRHEIYREQDGPRAVYLNSVLEFLREQTRPGLNPTTPR